VKDNQAGRALSQVREILGGRDCRLGWFRHSGGPAYCVDPNLEIEWARDTGSSSSTAPREMTGCEPLFRSPLPLRPHNRKASRVISSTGPGFGVKIGVWALYPGPGG